MAEASQSAGRKRKLHASADASTISAKKRAKYQDARQIDVQTVDPTLTSNGELNIAAFIKHREYEINALDRSMRKARQGLMARAFQQVPRHLRRRTASHNAKKVPRRLRRRALMEMMEDNTPTVTSKTRTPSAKLRLRLDTAKQLKAINLTRKTVRQKKKEAKVNNQGSDPAKHVSFSRVPRIKKNTLAKAPTATNKFKKRQINKTWLPTHLWHSKRSKMTRTGEPLWRMAIPLSPTEKSYRSSHRAASGRGCIAWDISYMSSISCRGTDGTLEGLLKRLGFSGEGWIGARYTKWKAGTRFSSSWVSMIDSTESLIAPILVIWAPTNQNEDSVAEAEQNQNQNQNPSQSKHNARRKLNRQILIRIHPSGFLQLWQELLRAAKMQKPQVLVEDLRFEVGSIDVIGPGSTEALSGVLKCLSMDTPVIETWQTLSTVTNPALLPINALLSFNVADPRFAHPPKQVRMPGNEASQTKLMETLTNWPADAIRNPSLLFSHRARYVASKLPSQKAINRRKAAILGGQPIKPSDSDRDIPILLLASRPRTLPANTQGTWTLLAPWKCIDAIWRSLMYYPLTTGGTPKFGGLDQIRQIAFEQGAPWFPGDFPGTEAGKAWERTQAENRFDEWIRKPPSRRLAYHSIDLGFERRGEVGRGWACDWDLLLQETIPSSKEPTRKSSPQMVTQLALSNTTPLTQRQRKAIREEETAMKERSARERNTSSPESDAEEGNVVIEPEYCQIHASKARSIFASPSMQSLPLKPALASARITILTKGTPAPTARIYRIPRRSTKGVSDHAPPRLQKSPAAIRTDLLSTSTPPPAAQPSPAMLSSSSGKTGCSRADLRDHWLTIARANLKQNDDPKGKLKTNHHGMPRKQSHIPTPSLRHINVLPPRCPPEVYEQYGPKPPTDAEIKAEEQAALQVKLEEASVWDVHVPCPDEEDLIGFVTSGGYNLAEGRGTAIGGLWVQKIVKGWIADEHLDNVTQKAEEESRVLGNHDNKRDGLKVNAKAQKMKQKQIDEERHLCIVRNSGESVARLATWEICD